MRTSDSSKRIIHIPAEVDGKAGLRARVGTTVRSIDDARWELAAFVWSWTQKDLGTGRRAGWDSSRLSIRAFADLGLPGFRDRNTISRYHDIMADYARDHCIVQPGPGEDAILPPSGTVFPRITEEKPEPKKPEPKPKAELKEVKPKHPSIREPEPPAIIEAKPKRERKKRSPLEAVEMLVTHTEPETVMEWFGGDKEIAMTFVRSIRDWLNELEECLR